MPPTSSPDDLPALPAPGGVAGHVRYTVAAFRQLRAWRLRLSAIDVELREAVRRRDEALADVGKAALARGEAVGRSADRLEAFGDTVGALEAEQQAADARRDALGIELAAAEDDRRTALDALDGRIAELRATMAPLQRDAERARRKAAELERLLASQQEQRRSFEARLTRLGHSEAAADDADRVEAIVAERRALEARIDALDAAVLDHEQQRARALEPVGGLDTQLDELERALEAARAERAEAQRAGDARCAALTGRLTEAEHAAELLARRRRAVLVDLGREVMREEHGSQGEASEAARAALAQLEALRDERERLLARRAAFDGRPVRRTVGATVGALALLLTLWWWW
ncbi:MAG: hypothetical protein H6704_01080 [Myxococcales bacterium]|nr:hypothetical protein [Myxococcales bacterium]